jgi:uncharacterized protein (DUF1786 family)
MKFLLVDIGAGTMDILYYDDQSDLHYKAVVASPVRTLAKAAERLSGNLVVTGCEMGGGPVTAVLKRRAREADVAMTAQAAATLHHDQDRVREWGVRIVDDHAADRLGRDDRYHCLNLMDLEVGRLCRIVEGFGVPFSFDVVAVCAQDHGVPPAGVSHLDYRHNLFKEKLDERPFPEALLFRSDALPETFSRLSAIAKTAAGMPAGEIYVMDSGMAAILGASTDIRAQSAGSIMILDIATSHTVGAALTEGCIDGFFEYHTHDITRPRLESLLKELGDGKLNHETILEEGGHGAYVRESVGMDNIGSIISTGPRRRLMQGSRLPIVPGAPLGDNMMTGTVGLLEAVRRRKGLKPIQYV